MSTPSQTRPARKWTRARDKAFETALATIPENDPNRWEKIATHVPGDWSPEDMKEHYETLKSDVLLIESERVQLPIYFDDDVEVEVAAAEEEEVHLPPPVPSKKGEEEEHRTSTQVTIGQPNHRLPDVLPTDVAMQQLQLQPRYKQAQEMLMSLIDFN